MVKKQIIIVGIVIVLAVLVGVLTYKVPQNCPESMVPLDHVDIILTNKGFVPKCVSVKLHGTVTFSTDREKPFWPASNLHPTHGIYPEFDPREPLSPKDDWTLQFDKAGEWKYHDHLRSYFIGIIYVVS